MKPPKGSAPPEGLTLEQVGDQLDTAVKDVKTHLDTRLDDIAAKQAADAKALGEEQAKQFKELCDQVSEKGGLPGFDVESDPESPKRLNLAKMALGHRENWERGLKDDCPHEYEYSQEMRAHVAKTAQQSGIGEAGGLLISPVDIPGILEPLKATTVALNMGVNHMDGLSGGPLEFDRSKGGVTAMWKGESQPGVVSKETFDSFRLIPRELIGLAENSKKQIMQDNGALSRFLERRLGQELGLKRDIAFFKGVGGNQPVGIVEAPALSGTTTDFSDIDFDAAGYNADVKLEDMVVAMQDRNCYWGWGELFYVSTPKGLSHFRTAKDANGRRQDLFNNLTSDAMNGVSVSDRLWGHRYAMTTQLTHGTAADDFLAVMSGGCFIADWDVMEVTTSEHTLFAQNDIQIKAVMYTDSGVLRSEFVQRASGWSNV